MVGRSLGKAFSFGGVGGRTAEVDILLFGEPKGRVSFRLECEVFGVLGFLGFQGG
jgi:hypothetical protein